MSNRKDFVNFNTGGHTAHHSRTKGVEIQPATTPMKSTGDVDGDAGRAKASPKFEEIKPSAKASKEEEVEAIKKNIELEVDTDLDLDEEENDD